MALTFAIVNRLAASAKSVKSPPFLCLVYAKQYSCIEKSLLVYPAGSLPYYAGILPLKDPFFVVRGSEAQESRRG